MARLFYPTDYHQPVGVVSSDDGFLALVQWFNDSGTEMHIVATSKLRPRGVLTTIYIQQVLLDYPHLTP
jgi:hypothetical protein